VVVGAWAAELVEPLQVGLNGIRKVVEELVLIEGAVGATLGAGAVVRDNHDDRVVELSRLLEVVEYPSDLIVGV
jgi:hypothetical protein